MDPLVRPDGIFIADGLSGVVFYVVDWATE